MKRVITSWTGCRQSVPITIFIVMIQRITAQIFFLLTQKEPGQAGVYHGQRYCSLLDGAFGREAYLKGICFGYAQ